MNYQMRVPVQICDRPVSTHTDLALLWPAMANTLSHRAPRQPCEIFPCNKWEDRRLRKQILSPLINLRRKLGIRSQADAAQSLSFSI